MSSHTLLDMRLIIHVGINVNPSYADPHKAPMDFPHKGTVMRAFDLVLLAQESCWTNRRAIADLEPSCDVTVMIHIHHARCIPNSLH